MEALGRYLGRITWGTCSCMGCSVRAAGRFAMRHAAPVRVGSPSKDGRAEFPRPLWIPASPGFPLAREYGNDDAGGVHLMVQLARCERVSGVPAY